MNQILGVLNRIAVFLELQALRAGEADHLLREAEKKSRIDGLAWYLWGPEEG